MQPHDNKMPKKGERVSAISSSGKAKTGKAKGGKPKQLTAEQLYHQAQIALQFDDYDSARDSLRQAHKQEPENLEVCMSACMHGMAKWRPSALMLMHI